MKYNRKSAKVTVAGLLVTVSVLLAASLVISRARGERPLQVLYYTNSILRDNGINIDPRNLEFVQQYYLLENLALGLVRDDNRAVGGYVAGLASRWTRPNDSTWHFDISDRAVWSDGTPISLDYLASELCELSRSESRHLRILPLIKTCRLVPGTRTLEMVFRNPVDASLLHELSLADSVLLHPANKTRDWSISSGAYTVSSFSTAQREIILLKNPHFGSDVTKGTPDSVRLFWVNDPSELEAAFISLNVDIFPTLPHVFTRRQMLMSKNAQENFWGFPNTLHFFRFNWRNPVTAKESLRNCFSHLVSEALQGWSYQDVLISDRQMIPEGHKGRLRQAPVLQSVDMNLSKGTKLQLIVSPQMKELPEFLGLLQNAAEKYNAEIEFKYDSTTKPDQSPGSFASLYVFKGNQKDALGNWSFLFSSGGPFEAFASDFDPAFAAIARETDDNKRTRLLEAMHEAVLSRSLGVPVFFERAAIFSSGKYDLAGLNRFDLRPRFFRMTER